jgi:hypothetical protein
VRAPQEFAETGRIPSGPVVDGLDIPDQPRRMYEAGDFNGVPLIVGRRFARRNTFNERDPALANPDGRLD